MFNHTTVLRHVAFITCTCISQNGCGWWGASGGCLRKATLLRQSCLQPDTQDHAQSDFESLQDRANNISEQPVLLFDSPHSASLRSHRVSRASVCVCIPSCLDSILSTTKRSVFFTPSHQTFLVFFWNSTGNQWREYWCRPQKISFYHIKKNCWAFMGMHGKACSQDFSPSSSPIIHSSVTRTGVTCGVCESKGMKWWLLAQFTCWVRQLRWCGLCLGQGLLRGEHRSRNCKASRW